MYIDNETDNLFRKEYRQVAKITVSVPNSADTFVLTERDILQGGLSIERDLFTGSYIELGTTVVSVLKLSLLYGPESNRVPDNATLTVEIGVKKWDAYQWENAQVHYVPMGVFHVISTKLYPIQDTASARDENPATCDIVAYDNMIKFDKPVDATQITTPITVRNLIARICQLCGVTMASYSHSMVNQNYEVKTIPTGITYRQLLSQCTFMIASPCASINYAGELIFMWYIQDLQDIFDDDLINFNIDPSELYNLEMNGGYICSGLIYNTSDGRSVMYGTESEGAYFATEYTGCDIFDFDEYYGPDVPRPLPDPYEDSPLYKIYYELSAVWDLYVYNLESVPLPWIYPGYMMYIHRKGEDWENWIPIWLGHYKFTMNKHTIMNFDMTKPDNRRYTNYYDGSTQ